jgi:DNA-binding beta-propeller fold protein YncE
MADAIVAGMLRGVASTFLFAVLSAANARAAIEIHALSEIIQGHQVGGVTADMVGDLYVADFGETVWKISMEGERRVFATGLYGASGNAIDDQGNLLQANFYGDSITKIDRQGEAKPFAAGLSGPVGVAVDRKTREVYVANCRGNSIAKISPDGVVAAFAKSDLFKCPNGLTLDAEGALYTVNFRDNRMLKIDRDGKVTPFATVSDKGLGHLCFSGDLFYVTAFRSNQIFQVSVDGKAKRLLGNGERGLVDGPDGTARLTFPNGIACHPWGERLYINEYVGETDSSIPRRAIVRQIILDKTGS